MFKILYLNSNLKRHLYLIPFYIALIVFICFGINFSDEPTFIFFENGYLLTAVLTGTAENYIRLKI